MADSKRIKVFSYPGNFIHGIDLNNMYPCWNLTLSGKLHSPDFSALIDAGIQACHQRIRDTSLEMIEQGQFPQGAYSPRGIWFIQAAQQIRCGEYAQWRERSPTHLNSAHVEEITKTAHVELAFERRRRIVAPEAVSRLSCIYVADDNEFGRRHLQKMLGHNVHILKVTIPAAIGITKCDTKWFDKYWDDQNNEYIDNYWKGESMYEGHPTWEYLLDGMIQANDPEGIKYIRDHYVNIGFFKP